MLSLAILANLSIPVLFLKCFSIDFMLVKYSGGNSGTKTHVKHEITFFRRVSDNFDVVESQNIGEWELSNRHQLIFKKPKVLALVSLLTQTKIGA